MFLCIVCCVLLFLFVCLFFSVICCLFGFVLCVGISWRYVGRNLGGKNVESYRENNENPIKTFLIPLKKVYEPYECPINS